MTKKHKIVPYISLKPTTLVQSEYAQMNQDKKFQCAYNL